MFSRVHTTDFAAALKRVVQRILLSASSRTGIGVLCAVLAASTWGAAGALTEGLLHTAPAFGVLAVELTVAACVLAVASVIRRAKSHGGAMLGLIDPALGALLSFTALAFTTLGAVAIAAGVEPALTAILALLVLGERVSLKGWAGVGLTGLGVALLTTSEAREGTSLVGFGFALAAAAVGAVYTVLARKAAKVGDPLALAARQTLVGGMAVLVFVLVIGVPILPDMTVSPDLWKADVLALAAVSGILAYALPAWLFLEALKRIRASTAGQLVAFAPVAAVLAGVIALGETLSLVELIGGSLILIASLFATEANAAAQNDAPPFWLAFDERPNWWVVLPTLPAKRGRELSFVAVPRRIGVWIWSGDI